VCKGSPAAVVAMCDTSWEAEAEAGAYTPSLLAQPQPCLTHKNTLRTLNTPLHPLNMGYTIPTRTPYFIKSAHVELRSERVEAPGRRWRRD